MDLSVIHGLNLHSKYVQRCLSYQFAHSVQTLRKTVKNLPVQYTVDKSKVPMPGPHNTNTVVVLHYTLCVQSSTAIENSALNS